ncbi:hypothetical protein ACRRTK_002680 [Alexandromys fortis]
MTKSKFRLGLWISKDRAGSFSPCYLYVCSVLEPRKYGVTFFILMKVETRRACTASIPTIYNFFFIESLKEN